MSSPFPGMDPYLEKHWPDVNATLAVSLSDRLNAGSPDDLYARVGRRTILPAGSVDDADPGAPFRRSRLIDPLTAIFVAVCRLDSDAMVTVADFLNPYDKRGRGLAAYMIHRQQLTNAGVHHVEIDLSRSGVALDLPTSEPLQPALDCSYRVVIRSSNPPSQVRFYPVRLSEPLPAILFPLREGDRQSRVELKSLLDRAYDTGRYARRLNYSADPVPPLDGDDAAWADALLRAAGKR